MISIIVPIYNVEKYLEACLLSIQNQTYRDFECIMVNDGSTDRSAEIAQKFVDKDARFKLIHQENGGQSSARNTGLKHVNGDFITFVDSDDLLHSQFLKICIKEIGDFDIIEAQMERFFIDDSIDMEEVADYNEKVYFDSKNTIQAVSTRILMTSPCVKLFSKNVLKDIHFPEGRIYEDMYVMLSLYKKGYSVKKISFVGYFYRKGHTSTLESQFNVRDWDLFYICEQIEKEFKDEVSLLPIIYKILAGNMMYQYLYKTNLLTKGRNRHKKMIRKYSKKSINYNLKQKLMLVNLDVLWIANYLRVKVRRKLNGKKSISMWFGKKCWWS